MALNVIEEWGKNWGFEISPDKTQVVVFNAKLTEIQKEKKTQIKWQRIGIQR